MPALVDLLMAPETSAFWDCVAVLAPLLYSLQQYYQSNFKDRGTHEDFIQDFVQVFELLGPNLQDLSWQNLSWADHMTLCILVPLRNQDILCECSHLINNHRIKIPCLEVSCGTVGKPMPQSKNSQKSQHSLKKLRKPLQGVLSETENCAHCFRGCR